MAREDIGALTDRFIATLHRLESGEEGALEAMVGLFADEAHLVSASLKLAGDERRGRDGARRFWEEYAALLGDGRSEFAQVTTNGEAAGLFWTTRGAGGEGQGIAYDGVTLLVFDGAGLISLFRGYYDTRELGRAVGTEG